MENPLILTIENPSKTISINKERPYFKIIEIVLSNYHKTNSTIFEFAGNSSIKKEFLKNKISIQNDDIILQKAIDIQTKTIKSQNPEKVDSSDEITFTFIPKDSEITQIEIHYEIEDLFLPINDPFIEFETHLKESDNVKILFSAPFGHGKTTFLNEFFKREETKVEYNVIHLFPVSYSIAKNEDIQEFIKCDILYNVILNPKVNFKKDSFSYLKTLPEFIKQNADKILAPFLLTIPKVGASLFKAYEEIKKLSNSFFEFHEKSQTDDFTVTKDFIERFFDNEGSIYEQDFYTELIKHFLDQIKQKGKQNVLIIDDLDRMDPEHIFRILNIFASHFDSREYTETSNKFGFDKIIIVCDYSNIARIFHHKYGKESRADALKFQRNWRQDHLLKKSQKLNIQYNSPWFCC